VSMRTIDTSTVKMRAEKASSLRAYWLVSRCRIGQAILNLGHQSEHSRREDIDKGNAYSQELKPWGR